MTAMTTSVSPFNFGTAAVRVVIKDSTPWFVATDVCKALGYTNTSKAVGDHLDDDEKQTMLVPRTSNDSLGVETNVINESGLYALVLRSRKPEARKFAKWVTSEVLPAIRKTGSYQQQPTPADYLPVPNGVLERAADMAGQVFAAAVKSAAFQKGHIDRFLVTSDFVNGKAEMQQIERDAYVMPMRKLLYLIRSGSPEVSVNDTLSLMNACAHGIAVHHSYMQKR